jgi:hypothetical protein
MDDNDSSHLQQHLANQRTFLAWLRTCVALIGLGFVVAKFGLYLIPIFSGGDLSTYFTNPVTSFETSTHFFFNHRNKYGDPWNCLRNICIKKLYLYVQIHKKGHLCS